jgi:lactoylglutathione lyase
MEIVKPALDVGLFTAKLDEDLAFWRRAMGLPSEPRLKLGGGIHQHRFRLGSSVLKINHSLQPLAQGSSGIRGVTIVPPGVAHPRVLATPGGAWVRVATSAGPPGVNVVVHLDVGSRAAHDHFWGEMLQLRRHGTDGFRCGRSLIEVREVSDPPQASTWKTLGWSYLTVQVRDCVVAHREALRLGACEGEPPRRMGNAAVISFLRDPDGNFVELSQKASIVDGLDPDLP